MCKHGVPECKHGVPECKHGVPECKHGVPECVSTEYQSTLDGMNTEYMGWDEQKNTLSVSIFW